jgi:hypothetical protein
MKLELYYVIKVTTGRSSCNKIVEDAVYISGPFGEYSSAVTSSSLYQSANLSMNNRVEIATQYIELEI